jgi:putative hydrolase of the HAD superfamily
MIRAVLFDLFGTLVDNATNEQVDTLLRAMADALAVPHNKFIAGWKATFHERARGTYGSMAGAIEAAAKYAELYVNPSSLEHAVKIRYDFMHDWLKPRPDAISTLTELRIHGHRIGLLSNCTQDVPLIWPAHPFHTLIDTPLFSCAEGLRKPSPEFYTRALTRMNITANGELAAANTLGFRVIMIRPANLLNDYRTDPEEDWDGPRVERLSELIELI